MQRNNYVKTLGVPPGPPTQMGIYASPEFTGNPYPVDVLEDVPQNNEPPEGWPRKPYFNPPGDVPGPPAQWGPPITPEIVKPEEGFIGNDVPENDIFFFHPDHLGSTSCLTGKNGEITQNVAYLPFGDVFFEEHNSKFQTQYLFNGKLLDEETNMSYFSARYKLGKFDIWERVDPLALYNPLFEDQFYYDGQHNGGMYNPANFSVYGYCYQNPTKYIDPNGKQVYFMTPPKLYTQGAYSPKRVNGRVSIDNNMQAVQHYFRGGGENVVLGTNTQNIIKNHPRIKEAINNLATGQSASPAQEKSKNEDGIGINLTGDMFHLGSMGFKYKTKCDGGNCVTTFTVNDQGFVDPNFISEQTLGNLGVENAKADGKGANLEVGDGKPYDYDPVKWSVKYKNPGYEVDKNGNPLPMNNNTNEANKEK